jgi:hypothetical protein
MKTNLQTIDVENAKVGMYVESIDRPISQTPFPVHGFHIRSDVELITVKRLCRTIRIDLLKSKIITVNVAKNLNQYNTTSEGKNFTRRPEVSAETAEKLSSLRNKRGRRCPICIAPLVSLISIICGALYYLQHGINLFG